MDLKIDPKAFRQACVKEQEEVVEALDNPLLARQHCCNVWTNSSQ